MKERPILFSGEMVRALLDGHKTQTRRLVRPSHAVDGTPQREGPCPYGAPGDRLWVRETHAPNYFEDGRPAYRADWTGESADLVREPRWTPAIHMPRALSRLDLEVAAVRVERLHDITEEDALAEGVRPSGPPPHSAYGAFKSLWYTLNGASWNANPWVWVVSFKRLRP